MPLNPRRMPIEEAIGNQKQRDFHKTQRKNVEEERQKKIQYYAGEQKKAADENVQIKKDRPKEFGKTLLKALISGGGVK